MSHEMLSATAVVLAGGRSSRMGSAKALLPFDGRPLIERIVSALAARFDDVVVVTAIDQELPPLAARVARDKIADRGPVAGMCAGLEIARHDACFVTSCDSVFLNATLIRHLLSRLPGNDVVVPRWQDRLQPLHAIYRRSVLPLLDAQLARGELRPVHLFDRVRTLTIGEDEIRMFDPDGLSFFNMNTPGDYAEAVKRFGTQTFRTE